jgi:hypothetical protein
MTVPMRWRRRIALCQPTISPAGEASLSDL